MKPSIQRLGLALSLLLLAWFLAIPDAVASIGCAALVALGDFRPASYHLGVTQSNSSLGQAYPQINTTTLANLLATNSQAQEILWSRAVIDGADMCYQDNPLSESGFMARVRNRKPNSKELRKCIISITDTTKVKGQYVNIPTVAGFGGPGVSGEGVRIGNEQKIVDGNIQVKIDILWFGAGFTGKSRDMTVIGSEYDLVIIPGLRQQHAKKRSDDNMMRLRAWAQNLPLNGGSTPTIGARNNIFPDGISSVASLKTANVLDTTLITNMGQTLPRLGGMPMDTTNDSGGSIGECYMCLATDIALAGLETEPAYLNAQQYGGDRGETNRVFAGGYSKWNGQGIYRFIQRDHANKGPVGSPICQRALLGAATTNLSSTKIQGGGFAYLSGDIPAPNYFEFFDNAYYQFYNGDTIAQNTSPTKYILIVNPTPNSDGTSWNVYSYTTIGDTSTDSHSLTVASRLSLGLTGEQTGGNAGNHAIGAVISQCSVLGVPYGFSFHLGAQALVCGAGSIDGKPVEALMGRRTEEVRNHGMDIGIGAEGVWGNQVVTRAGDGSAPNFLMATHALNIAGAPIVV